MSYKMCVELNDDDGTHGTYHVVDEDTCEAISTILYDLLGEDGVSVRWESEDV